MTKNIGNPTDLNIKYLKYEFKKPFNLAKRILELKNFWEQKQAINK